MSTEPLDSHSPRSPVSRPATVRRASTHTPTPLGLNRRDALALALLTATTWLGQRTAPAAETRGSPAKKPQPTPATTTTTKSPAVSLHATSTDGQFRQFRQFQVTVASSGELKLNADGQKVARRSVQVDASFRYDETTRLLSEPGAETVATSRIRRYAEAQAAIRVGASRFTSELKPSRRLAAIHAELEQLILYSPSGPLSRDELDLIEVPGAVSQLEELLPDKPVAPADRWSWSPESLARLLRLEAVQEAKVEARLVEVDKSVALIEAEGHVSGAVGGVATEIDVAAKLNFDLDRRMVTWLALGLKENRAIGHAEPGFETTTQIKIIARPIDESDALSPEVLSATSLDYGPGSSLLLFDSTKGHFRLLLDRRWRTMVDREDLTVLRFVDRGDLVAQCNASPLPMLAPGKQLSLEEFQDDIKQSLAKTFRQFAEASQSTTDDGLRVLRVAAVGESSGLAVQWNYYHVSNDAGRRLALVFTFESTLYDRFAETDRSVVSSVQFLTQPEPTKAKTARKN